MNHCVAKIVELVERGQDDRRSILQLGYNLGRLSELSGLGREPFWDRWKEPVAAWELTILRRLAHELLLLDTTAHTERGDLPSPASTSEEGV